jgi:hypothetical protein
MLLILENTLVATYVQYRHLVKFLIALANERGRENSTVEQGKIWTL